MAGMLKIAVLALVLTAAGKLSNAAESKVPKAPGSTSETTTQHTLQEFWKNYKKVWTANSTVPYYGCEWQEPTNINETGLQIITHFDTINAFTLNWTFAEKNTMKSKLKEGVFTRYMVYQNNTCAVFKDEFRRKISSKEAEGSASGKKKKEKGKKGKKKTKYSVGVDYRMVFDDTKKGHVPADCREEYRKVIGNATNYRIYRNACRKAQAKKNH
uniref:Lipocalin n=1 Tax=Rhipicephalus zambeziensis TaxID=60191 RepID=A0A224YN75_9ACAR